MKIIISENPKELGIQAGKIAAKIIKQAIASQGYAHIILATGSSQFETLHQLIEDKDIQWDKVTAFHLDEYIGLAETHQASFRKYLNERFLAKVSPLKNMYLVNGENDPEKECRRLEDLITKAAIDVALVGIGENGHLAFNDPPADFDTQHSYIIVNLDAPCRQQQVNEGWFEQLEDVPKQAISMSISQIMKAKNIISSVPDARKAAAVQSTIENKVSPLFPASILQQHPSCYMYLEVASAKDLDAKYKTSKSD